MNALVLVASPLQAELAQRLLEAEKVIDFDVLYFSSADSLEDRNYFERIARSAAAAHYFHLPNFSWLAQIVLAFWRIRRAQVRRIYSFAVLASLTSIPITTLAFKRAPIFLTFDDGLGNYNSASRMHRDSTGWRARGYRTVFKCPPLSVLKEKIARHYTVHPNLPNIVEHDRVRALPGWTRGRLSSSRGTTPKTYFIGSIIDEFFNPELGRLGEILSNYSLDFYVAHTRESQPLDLGVPLLDKRGLIAEEAILNDAAGRPFHLIGWPSTVFFNLSFSEKRTLIFPKAATGLIPIADLAKKSGCEVLYI